MREKLIELLCKAHNAVTDKSLENDSEFGMTYAEQIETEADSLIANGVTIQKWIPVTERLPEQGKCVLIYSDTGKVAEGQYTVTQDWTQFRWSAKNVIVTHWMPLPEPPSGERRTDA